MPGLVACSSSDDEGGSDETAGGVPRDSLPDGLYRDFLDGKYDSAGHPIGAEVWQAESGCNAKTGRKEAEGRGLRVGTHKSGTVCTKSSTGVAVGRYTLNVYALVYTTCADGNCDPEAPVFTLTAKSASGSVIESTVVKASAFEVPMVYQSVPLKFVNSTEGAVTFEVRWEGKIGARVDYVELFRSNRNMIVTPVSSVLDPTASFEVDVQDPPKDMTLTARCDETDLTSTLDGLIASGDATREDTEFRTVYSLPASLLLESCPASTRVRFQASTPNFTVATSRVSVYDKEPPCTFVTGKTKVMLTGFEPFPADATHDNSSEQAVTAFNPADVEGISLMRLTLPVEFDTAPGILKSAIQRCAPDVVVGFGQGRSAVDLETTAYNRKDSAEIAGGVPDNRGYIPGGEPVVAGGPAELSTGLPTEQIKSALDEAGIACGFSDDPGRYVCNNLFYRIMTESAGTKRVSGFVHLPYMHTVGTEELATLKQVVTEVVKAAVAKQRTL